MRERHHGAPWVHNRGCYTGPLVEHLEEFLECRARESYSPHTVHQKRAFVAALSRWLERCRIPLVRLDEGLFKRFRKQLPPRAGSGDDTTERQLLAFLRARDAIPVAAPAPIDRSPLGELTRDYQRFLRDERGLAPVTIVDDIRVVRRFLLQRFTGRTLRLQALVPQDIHRFLLEEAERVSRSRAQCAASDLRSFLRYLRQRGLIERDLVGAVPSVASYRLRRMPKFLPATQIQQILESCDRSTALGQRDYAMLLLMARLGLRCGEVAALTLEDFNWERGEFIVRGKGPRHEPLPLPQEVGAALLAYLRHSRPDCPARHVFVGFRAPHRRLVDGRSVDYVVKAALKRAGLNPPFKGSHLLRHSLATNLLSQGASLVEIGQLLRHRKQVTTQIYAKVDLRSLRPIALPWMGGVR